MKRMAGLFGLVCATALLFGGCATQEYEDIAPLDKTTAIIVSSDVAQYPQHVDVYRSILKTLRSLAAHDDLSMGDVRDELDKIIDRADTIARGEIKMRVADIFDRVSNNPRYDFDLHHDKLMDIIEGIAQEIKKNETKTSK